MEKVASYKFIILLSTLYITVNLTAVVLSYRLMSFGHLTLPGGTIIFPLSYFLGDVIAEVYGYKISRQLIWATSICSVLYTIVITFVIYSPYPENWNFSSDYIQVLGHSFRFVLVGTIGSFCGLFMNAYIISKTKLYTHGKYFPIRSIVSTAFGEAVLTIIVYTGAFAGILTFSQLLALITAGYTFKLIYAVLASYPGSWLVEFLKKKEDADVYDSKINFSPFSFRL